MIENFLSKPKTECFTQDGLYRQYNQWGNDLDSFWLVRFLRYNFPNNTIPVNFFGPLGTPFFVKRSFPGMKVFYSAEDVEHSFTKLNLYYGDYCLNSVDLALGFGRHDDNKKYLRFPYWILTTFEPEFNEDDIRKRIGDINKLRYTKSQDCVLINKHDKKGTREMIYNDIKNIMEVKLAGTWKNNTRDLWDKYGNDKMAYVRTFRFNICPENDNTKDYVTEKLFDAFMCGCVPMYYGSNNDPEPGLINKDAVIFWDKEANNQKSIAKVEELYHNDKLYEDFMAQVKLLPAAEEYVIDRYARLKDKFAELLL